MARFVANRQISLDRKFVPLHTVLDACEQSKPWCVVEEDQEAFHGSHSQVNQCPAKCCPV